MSGIYIHGMEMPKNRGEYTLRVYVNSDGTATVEGSYCRFEGEPFVAVPVQPHGRLIDADALKKNAYPFSCAIGTEWAVTLRQINDAHTIIPPSGGKEDE